METIIPLAVVLSAGGFLAVAVLGRWKTGVILLVIWVYLEDIVRRLIPGQPPEVKLVTDALVLLVYVSLFAAVMVRGGTAPYSWRPPFLTGVMLFLGVSILGALNPNSPGVLFSAVGFKSYFWYIPLAFAGYSMFRNAREMERFCRILVYTSIPLFGFAVLQFVFFETDHPLIRPLEGGIPYHFFSFVEGPGIPFITSVFGSAGRYARVSLFTFLLGLALWCGDTAPGKGARFLLLIAIVCAALGVVFSGSRVASYLLPVSVLWFFRGISGGRARVFGKGVRRKLAAVGSALLLFLIGVSAIVPQLRAWIVLSIPHVYERLFVWMPNDVAAAVRWVPTFGFGTGAFSQGIQYLPGGEEWMEIHRQATWRTVGDLGQTAFMESGIAKLIYEFGLPGPIIFYIFIWQVLSTCSRQVSLQSTVLLERTAQAIYVFVGLLVVWFSFVHHQVLGDPTTLVLLWFFVGVTCRLRTLPQGSMAQDGR